MTQETSDGVPISDGFDFPVGKPDAQGYYVAAGLADPDYFANQGGVWHPGEDWNGTGGGDTDLGQPVYTVSHGKVLEAAYNPVSWGNLVLVEHALPDGTRAWSQYAHLDKILVMADQKVARGQQIGTIGKGANNRYPAHLHFEIRRNKLSAGNWTPMVKNRDQVLANYYDPREFIKSHRPGMLAQPVQPRQAQPSPVQPPIAQPATPSLQITVDSQRTDPTSGRFRRARTDDWYSAPVGAYGSTLWTYVSAQQEINWGEWRPNLPAAGRYEVLAFIPGRNATTRNARYLVVHADGQTEAAVNQDGISDQWVRLGTFRFAPGQGYLRLSDRTGESERRMIAFDAAQWVKVS